MESSGSVSAGDPVLREREPRHVECPTGGVTIDKFGSFLKSHIGPGSTCVCMPESDVGDGELGRALDLADGYLSEAEAVLWTAAAESDSAEVADTVETLTEDLWELQHRLRDLRSDGDA